MSGKNFTTEKQSHVIHLKEDGSHHHTLTVTATFSHPEPLSRNQIQEIYQPQSITAFKTIVQKLKKGPVGEPGVLRYLCIGLGRWQDISTFDQVDDIFYDEGLHLMLNFALHIDHQSPTKHLIEFAKEVWLIRQLSLQCSEEKCHQEQQAIKAAAFAQNLNLNHRFETLLQGALPSVVTAFASHLKEGTQLSVNLTQTIASTAQSFASSLPPHSKISIILGDIEPDVASSFASHLPAETCLKVSLMPSSIYDNLASVAALARGLPASTQLNIEKGLADNSVIETLMNNLHLDQAPHFIENKAL